MAYRRVFGDLESLGVQVVEGCVSRVGEESGDYVYGLHGSWRVREYVD